MFSSVPRTLALSLGLSGTLALSLGLVRVGRMVFHPTALSLKNTPGLICEGLVEVPCVKQNTFVEKKCLEVVVLHPYAQKLVKNSSFVLIG
jgi:hypothetical protein